MSRILITRPWEDSLSLAEHLSHLGHEVLIEPMLEIEFLPVAPPEVAGFQGVLFTSANGVRAFQRLIPDRTLPVFAVGDATAATASAAGFPRVASAGGDVMALARLVADRCNPGDGPLLHVAASERAGDLGGELGRGGFAVTRRVLYQAHPAHTLSTPTVQALGEGALDAVLLFSPRTARAFSGLVRASGLRGAIRGACAVCLSAAVAEAATAPVGGDQWGLEWREVKVAARPDQEALLALVKI